MTRGGDETPFGVGRERIPPFQDSVGTERLHQVTGRAETLREIGEAAFGGPVEGFGEKGDFLRLTGEDPLGLDRGEGAVRRIDRSTRLLEPTNLLVFTVLLWSFVFLMMIVVFLRVERHLRAMAAEGKAIAQRTQP